MKKRYLRAFTLLALIMTMETQDGIPEFGPEEGIKNLWKIPEAGKLLFFPFSETNVGVRIRCADGQKRRVEDDSEIIMGDIDCAGFLFQWKEGVFYIDAAIHSGGMCPGPPPSIDIQPCGCFDSGMATFVDRFIMS